MSKKWFVALLIASVIGLIIVVSLKFGPAIMVMFGPNKSQSTSTISPTPDSREEGPTTNTTRPTSEVRSMPTETTRTQEQDSTPEQRPSEDTLQRPLALSTFENSSYGLRMQYPSNWQIVYGGEDNDGVVEIAGFVSPFDDGFDTYKERLWLFRDSLPLKNMTLEDYSNEVIKQASESSQDFELLDNDTDSIILAGYPAYRLVYTRTLEDGTTIKQMEIGTKIGEKLNYLTYYAEEEKYHDFLPVIQDMIDSFQIQR